MSAFLRCAACGSPRVMMDEKSEGYSLAKGILGTALIGNVGVVAGINGKKKKYYHCPDCGTTLSYPMESTVLKIINDCISNPTDNVDSLRRWKKTYPNIEWNDSKIVAVKQVPISNDGLSDSDSRLLASVKADLSPFLDKDEEWISNILRTRITTYRRIKKIRACFISLSDLKEAIGFTDETVVIPKLNNSFQKAIARFQKSGDVKVEKRENVLGYYFYSDEEKKTIALEELSRNVASTIYKNNGIALCEEIKQALPESEWIIESEVKNIAYNVFMEYSQIVDPSVLEELYSSCVSMLLHNIDLLQNKTDDSTVIYRRLNDDEKALEINRREDAKAEYLKQRSLAVAEKIKQKELAAKKLMLLIGSELSSSKEYTENDLEKLRKTNSTLKNAYSSDEFMELLCWGVHFGLLEFDGYTFVLPGTRIDKSEEILEKISSEEKS